MSASSIPARVPRGPLPLQPRLKPNDLLDAGLRCAEGVLRSRGQWTEVVRERGFKGRGRSEPRLAAMVAHAICEVAALSRSRSEVRINAGPEQMAISGANPIDLPEHQLQLDDILRMRCRALDVGVTLHWEQGAGPRLVLALPGPQAVGSR